MRGKGAMPRRVRLVSTGSTHGLCKITGLDKLDPRDAILGSRPSPSTFHVKHSTGRGQWAKRKGRCFT